MNKVFIQEKLNKFEFNNLDIKFFNIAIFLLASAPFISCLLFLYPLIRGLKNNNSKLLSDFDNKILIIVSLIMISKSLISSFFISHEINSWDPSLNWAGLANWIPLFLCFLGLNEYLDNEIKRRKVTKLLIAGTIPVLISCIGQYWFKWHGPIQIFNGLIIWFQRPLSYTHNAVTGLFNNQNYTASWLAMIFPLIITLSKEKIQLKHFTKYWILIFIAILNIFFVILTNSRNGFIGLLIPFIFIIRRKTLKLILLILLFSISLILFLDLSFINSQVKEIYSLIIPSDFNFNLDQGVKNLNNYPRVLIWLNAILFIAQKPLFGWGSSSFAYLFHNKTGIWNYHAHNLFLEMSISFGLIVSLLTFFVFIKVLIKSFRFIIIKNRSIIDKGWWIAGFIFFISHLYDVLIFDIRINIIGWFLLIGLKNSYVLKPKEYKS